MRSLVVLAGQINDDEACRIWLETADEIICADGGARHVRRIGLKPDLLIGDMDSIDQQDLNWIQDEDIPIIRHAVRKNETDAELAFIETIRHQSDQADDENEIIVLGALGTRADHVLATQLLAASLAKPNRLFLLTDGVTLIWTLVGGQTLALNPSETDRAWAVSVSAISDTIEGLTYQGLAYPLKDAVLSRGTSLGVSNQLAAGVRQVTNRLRKGTALVVMTPADG